MPEPNHITRLKVSFFRINPSDYYTHQTWAPTTESWPQDPPGLSLGVLGRPADAYLVLILPMPISQAVLVLVEGYHFSPEAKLSSRVLVSSPVRSVSRLSPLSPSAVEHPGAGMV